MHVLSIMLALFKMVLPSQTPGTYRGFDLPESQYIFSNLSSPFTWLLLLTVDIHFQDRWPVLGVVRGHE